MPRQAVPLDDLIIPAGQGKSNWVEFKGALGDTEVITIYSPSGSSPTINVEVDSGRGYSGPLYYKGSVVAVAAAGAATNIPVPACRAIRLSSASIEADRVFQVLVLLGV